LFLSLLPDLKISVTFKSYGLKLCCWILGLSCTTPVISQEHSIITKQEDVRNQIGLRHDNDFLTFTDKYYSSGLFLFYKRVIENVVFKTGQEQISLGLIQQIYTPSESNTTNLAEMDRPFAGYSEVQTGWSYIKNDLLLETHLSFGLVGKASGAGDFHKWYHNALAVPNPPTWAYELDNKFHANLYTTLIQEWQLAPNNFSVYFAVKSEFALGTKDVYAQPELLVHFGRRLNMSSSMAYNSLGSKENEVFFTLRAGYRYVGYNALLEGHISGDDSVFLVDPKNRFFYGGFDIKHRFGKDEYWLGYRFNSAETTQTKGHTYIILSYARSF
jgi:hypothetical protein